MNDLIEKSGYTVLPSFVFRVPILPLTSVESDDWLAQTHTEIFKEAVFLASPDLYAEFTKFIADIDQPEHANLKLSLLKYFLRMSSRCTPFGIFAGCGAGNFATNNEIVLASPEAYRSFTRLDMNFICSLIDKIIEQKNIKGQLKLYPNSSLYALNKEFRYVEYKYLNTKRKHFLTSLQKDDYLSGVLNEATKRVSLAQLVDYLQDDEITADDAEAYISELIDNQVLVTDLGPAVTGDALFEKLVSKLRRMSGADDLVARLDAIQRAIDFIDGRPIGRSIDIYEQLHAKIKALATPFEKKYLLQTDLAVTADRATLNEQFVSKVYEGVTVLNRLTRRNENGFVKKFKEEFHRRFENEEIALVKALDTDTGITFGGRERMADDVDNLLNGLALPLHTPEGQEVFLSPALLFIHQKYEEFISNPDKGVIELNEKELKDFPAVWTDLPDTLACLIDVFSVEEDKIQIGFSSIGGTSAANILGRFCHIDKNIEKAVMDISRIEQKLHPDAILAEIAHLPESRVGNILFRPALRDHEISYLANASENATNIDINDIMISVPNGDRIRLRSKKLNKEIIPRLSTAHNYNHNALPIYQFLCSVQTQNLRTGLQFDWGPLLINKPHLPRVSYKGVILSPAKWSINASEIKNLLKENGKLVTNVDVWRQAKNLPGRVLLVDGDNKLMIDLSHELSIRLLIDEAGDRQSIHLEEFLFSEQHPLVARDGMGYANQILMCLHKN